MDLPESPPSDSRLVVALDALPVMDAIKLASQLAGQVWGFKINDLLFEGGIMIQQLKNYGRVFADAKLFDTPNTVRNSTQRLVGYGADLISVHATGGVKMMEAAIRVADGADCNIAAVTTLTSMSDDQVLLAYERERAFVAYDLAQMAADAGCDWCVCSSHELIDPMFKNIGFQRIVPGLRPHGQVPGDDLVKVGGYAEMSGADLVVAGRLVTFSPDPVARVQQINQGLKGAKG